MTNIRELAKMAGVSVSTVSRVMNNHPYVSEEKRNAVLAAIRESNYQPNINAIHLSMGKTFLVGVVVPYIDHPYFALLLKGMAIEALENNYKLVLFQSNYEEAKEFDALKMLKQKQIDALIICSRICSWSTVEEFMPYGPIVLCEDTRGKNVSSTYVDHYKTFIFALEYLYQKGHRKIGYSIGRKTGSNSKFRGMAFKDFIKDYQLPYEPAYIFDECLYFEDGERVISQIKQMDDPPTALLITSDEVAAGIVTCAQQQDISVPGDLALIGFNNQPIAKMMNITTIEIPLVEMGRKLFLQGMVDCEATYQEIPVTLIERRTV
ncbi:LacI family DNA-binding transcriptional regulator [Neobacillus sp. MM2021_6]|uniref:LacI family DNA-binding transcriptional regulator n=1 Tax=Bacillaceae TaxID=186817 RepID=UPI00140A9F9D|nr:MULTISPECIES: LacI family DNA-binding transcriptional regulator [Bacillaceae]MBO0959583.1 LacI family DNA-binding transcriptional regulator [Neobacillus sp. MM2021_6]NHC20181.1 LacI family DNA-binding transcriptional regulator [Bacillus sp. MM2020_4]